MKTIKIVYVIASLKTGGAEKQLFLLLSGLTRTKYSPAVITFTDGIWRGEIEKLNVPVIVIKHASKLRTLFSLTRNLLKIRPDIVHTIGIIGGVLGRLAAVFTNRHFILHSERSAADFKPLRYNLIENVLNRFTDKIICNASHSAEYYRKKSLISPHKLSVIKNGIDIKKYPAVDIEKNVGHVGYLANFRSMKNHILIVEAAAILISRGIEIKVHFGGEGPTLPDIKNQIKERELTEHFIFHGSVQHVPDFFCKLSQFLQVSLYEGFPNALMEAMASALPCIATNTSGNRELLEASGAGYLVSPDDAQRLSELIVHLYLNPKESRRYGYLLREYINENLSIEAMVRNTESIYQNYTHEQGAIL